MAETSNRRPDSRQSSYRPAGPGGSSQGGFRRPYITKKKECQFCKNRIKVVDYKQYEMLRRFMSDRGKILSCRITGTCFVHQKQLGLAVRRARTLALLPYTTVTYDA